MSPNIEIICPKCFEKAAFYAPKSGSYVVRPSVNGKVICGNCGLNKEHIFDSKDYYYSIPIKGRNLYARTFENLKLLETYFKENKRLHDPDLDFPKIFYENRLELVKLIGKRIQEELSIK